MSTPAPGTTGVGTTLAPTQLTGLDAQEALAKNYPHRPPGNAVPVTIGVLTCVVIVLIASYNLRSASPLLSVWGWLGSAAVLGFLAFYYVGLEMQCRDPYNAAYCQARRDLSYGKSITARPGVVGVGAV